MDNTPLEKIKKYCSERKDVIISQVEIDFMYRRFHENLQRAIQEHEQKNSKPITDQEYALLRDTLLSDINLEMLYGSAHTYYERMEHDIKNSVKKDIDKTSFWKSVFASMISNFLYTVVLFLIVFFGKDHVNGIIDSFRNEPENKIEQKNTQIIEGDFEEIDSETE